MNFVVSGISRAMICAGLASFCVGMLAIGSSVSGQERNRDDRILDRRAGPDDRRDYRARDRFRDDDRSGRRDFGDRRGRDGQRYGSAPGQFDFYVLALSWSPTHCASESGRRSRFQCRTGAGNHFVVHGLWPQFERGSPSYCSEANAPRNVVESEGRVFPEFGLARYQWRKHGSCSGLSPSAYFRAVGQARAKVAVPPSLEKIDRGVRADPDAIERAFLAANKGLRPDQIAVTCVRGQLQEVRVCMSKDLRSFVSCQEVDRRACRASSVDVPPPR